MEKSMCATLLLGSHINALRNWRSKMAQFESFFSHVTNVHKGLPNKIFNKCAYSDVIKPRVWLTKGKDGPLYLVKHLLIYH